MGTNLAGTDAKIWELHTQGLCVTRIAGLVGLPAERVRGVIAGEWLEDKLAARSAKRSRKG